MPRLERLTLAQRPSCSFRAAAPLGFLTSPDGAADPPNFAPKTTPRTLAVRCPEVFLDCSREVFALWKYRHTSKARRPVVPAIDLFSRYCRRLSQSQQLDL